MAYIALWELQAIVMMLHQMAFGLSNMVVALHLVTALLRLICVIKVVQCLLFFPGWPA